MTKVKSVSILLGCVGMLLSAESMAQPTIGGGYLKNAFGSDTKMLIEGFAISVTGGQPAVCVNANKKSIQPGQTYTLDFSQCPSGSFPAWASGYLTDGSKQLTFSCSPVGPTAWTYQPGASSKIVYTVSQEGG